MMESRKGIGHYLGSISICIVEEGVVTLIQPLPHDGSLDRRIGQ